LFNKSEYNVEALILRLFHEDVSLKMILSVKN
jgi:hypothetical protein